MAAYEHKHKISRGGGVEEDIEMMEISFQKALQMLKIEEIRDGKTVILLQYALLDDLIK